MSKPRIFYNADCVLCGGIAKEMVMIGVVILCNDCYKTTFKTFDPVKEEREIYLELLEKQKEKALKEIYMKLNENFSSRIKKQS